MLVAVHDDTILDDHFDRSLRMRNLQVSHHDADDLRQVDATDVDVTRGGTRQAEQIVDELAHMLSSTAHTTEVLQSLRAQIHRVVVDQDLAEAVEPSKWRPKIVRDRVAESLELLVRRLELTGSLHDAPLELDVECPDLRLGSTAFGRLPFVDPVLVERDLDRAAKLRAVEWFDEVA